MNVVFYFDMQPGETAEEAENRLMCILDDIGIEYIGLGVPEIVPHDYDTFIPGKKEEDNLLGLEGE